MEESIREYAKELRTLIDKSYDSFEKQLNYISAGALGLSMIIVDKIVKDLSTTRSNYNLIMSWCFLGPTLVSNLLSHVYTSQAHSKTISEIYDEKYDYSNAVARNKKIGRWNIFSIAFLLIGITLQIIFIATNIKL